VAVVTAVSPLPRTAQPLSYHEFADQRGWLGIPNFLDVASNIVFAAAGLAGLSYLGGRSCGAPFIEAGERWFYVFVFLGLLLTAFGSSYYHLAPDNEIGRASCRKECRYRWWSWRFTRKHIR